MSALMSSQWSECTLDTLTAGFDSSSDPHYQTLALMTFISLLCFTVSTITANASQTDKLWSVTPWLYAWICVNDKRTLLMAVCATIWGLRLSWNFNRRGGYHFPKFWEGEEDYRWPALRAGVIPGFEFLSKPVPWMIFNFTFISFYQHFLLLLTAAPSLIAWSVSTSCDGNKELNNLDYFAAVLLLAAVAMEGISDNVQFAYQEEKYRLKALGGNTKIPIEYSQGFHERSFYAYFRKPNYVGEQMTWVAYYLFSVAAAGKLFNWSAAGFVLLLSLFQSSGSMTEKMSIIKYPLYESDYMKRVGRYTPFKAIWSRFISGGGKGKSE